MFEIFSVDFKLIINRDFPKMYYIFVLEFPDSGDQKGSVFGQKHHLLYSEYTEQTLKIGHDF